MVGTGTSRRGENDNGCSVTSSAIQLVCEAGPLDSRCAVVVDLVGGRSGWPGGGRTAGAGPAGGGGSARDSFRAASMVGRRLSRADPMESSIWRLIKVRCPGVKSTGSGGASASAIRKKITINNGARGCRRSDTGTQTNSREQIYESEDASKGDGGFQ